jgi:hypothetical protein
MQSIGCRYVPYINVIYASIVGLPAVNPTYALMTGINSPLMFDAVQTGFNCLRIIKVER